MRDITNKQGNDGTLTTIILVVVLVGGLSFVLAALGVGFVVWQVFKQQEVVHTPSPAPTPPPVRPGQPPIAQPVRPGQAPARPVPNNQPPAAPAKQQTQPPPQDVALKALPSSRPFEMDLSPPVKPNKRFEFTAVHTLKGHGGSVVAIALSPDEHRALSGGWDNTMRLWDLDNGKELATLKGHTGPVRGVAFSPDGKRAGSASLDGSLRLWDLEKKSSIRTFKYDKGVPLCVAFTPDGERLLAGGNDRAFRIWEAATGKQLHEWYGHDADVNSISVSPDGATALTGSSDGGATHWDLRSGRQLAYLSLGNPVFFALFTADGKRAILGGSGPVRLCDLSTGEQWPELPPTEQKQQVRAAALLPGDRFFLQVVGKRLEGRFLPTRHVHPGTLRDTNWNLLGEVEAHNGPVTSVCASRNGQLALTGGEDGAVKLWRIREHDSGEAR